ncbi:MAG: hydroxyacid dehydrogenase [Nitrosomonadaceae bacterium]|nr:hydroxyacid dehydrogenase [Nitrosomonadaceae bacterium]|tara:strand:- start:987 stop:1940 length:954 start_codon:yes stop_codon:yes gene_type:complete
MKKNNITDLPKSPKIVVTSLSFAKSKFLRQELNKKFSNCFFNETGRHLTKVELIEVLKDADAAIIGLDKIDESILGKASRLQIISKYGVGLDNIDQGLLAKYKIRLGWEGGVNRRSVAEVTLCFMLGLCRNIFNSGFSLKQMLWNKNGGAQITGKTVGIIGCGNIGSDVIQLLSPFRCNILVHDIIDKSEFCQKQKVKETDLVNLISTSDIISLHVPLTPQTKGMVDKSFISRMKSTAYLINTSRGDVVDQAALKNALINGDIAGAALDVFEEEPPKDKEFLSLPNLMVTPHMAGNSKEAIMAMGQSAINHLIDFYK